MTTASLRRIMPGLLLLPALAGFAFGGWATVTVEDLPDHVVAGRPVQLEFTVRQHGVEPVRGLEPEVEVRGRGAPRGAIGPR